MVAYPPVFLEQTSALATPLHARPILQPKISVMEYRLGENDVRQWSMPYERTGLTS
jgi:hypothetical protein